MGDSSEAKLVSGPVPKLLLKLSSMMFLGMLSTMAFNLIDTYFIGKLGTSELAGISFTFPVVMIIGGLSTGLGAGASAIISKAIGEGNQYKVQRLTSDSLVLALLIVLFFIVLGLLTIDPVFRLIGAEGHLLELVKQYMYYWYPGMFFLVIPMVGNNAIRATGDTKYPSIIMISSVLMNAVLDPIFIFGFAFVPRLEIAGAAIATVIARALTLIISLSVLRFKHDMLTRKSPKLNEVLDSWKKVLHVGVPTAATNIIIPFAMAAITAIIAKFGKEAVAGFGIANRVEMFSMIFIMALSSVLGPFIGQNLGALKFDRVREAIYTSLKMGIYWHLVVIIVLILFGEGIASIFDTNEEVISVAVLYFMLVPWSYSFQSINRFIQIYFTVLRKPLYASLLMILQMVVLYIPLAYSLSNFWGITGVFIGCSTANFIGGTAAFLSFKKTEKHFREEHLPESIS